MSANPAKPNKPTIYSVGVAKHMIKEVRLGKTLTQICRHHQMPELLTAYDWRDNPKNKIGKQSFANALAKAETDRWATWQDQMVESYDHVDATGTRRDHTELKRADAMNTLRLRLIREDREQRKGSTKNVGSDVNVTIKKFATPITAADRADLEQT